MIHTSENGIQSWGGAGKVEGHHGKMQILMQPSLLLLETYD